LNPAGFIGSVAQPDVVTEVTQPVLRLKLPAFALVCDQQTPKIKTGGD
jgi:hypothetical protein